MKTLKRDELTEILNRRANSDLELCNIGGASILVAQDGEIVYKEHFGFEDMCEKAVSDRTLFRLASMTKPVTAVATMILVERGLLSLDDTVDSFYPEFLRVQIKQEDGTLVPCDKKITIRNILTHSSGISTGALWQESAKKLTSKDKESVETFVEFISKEPLSFLPGSKQEYSGVGAFSVLTGIIQKIVGTTYGSFLQKEIFEPCRMTDTTFEPNDEQWQRIIAMHGKKDGKSIICKTCEGCVFESIPPRNHVGGAGLLSSLGDYFNFAEMLLCGGVFEGKRVISEKSVAEISKPQFFKRPEVSWGLGVRVITGEDSLPVGSYGWSGAYGSHFWIDPSNKIVAIYMKNSWYDGGSGATTSKNLEKDVYSLI